MRFRLLSASIVLFPLFALACSSSAATATDEDTGGGADVDVDTGIEAGGTQCTSARETAVGPLDKVATRTVTLISDTAGVKTLFVDGSAGGMNSAALNPWIYVDLETGARVDVNDHQAFTATTWDLAFKRERIHTNSGDAGLGVGGAGHVSKDFASVTAADVGTLAPESWFDADCNLKKDALGGIRTSFEGWYSYDAASMKLTPVAETWIVRGATGKLFKLSIDNYYATSSGGTGTAGGNYLLKVQAL